MSKSGISRRQFLETGGGTVAGGVAASITASLPVTAWAEALKVLEGRTADILLRVCRVMYPHDDLSDDYYAACVEGLDAKAVADETLARRLNDGAAKLDESAAGKFLDLPESKQVQALTAIENTAFFQAIRGHMVVALYNDRKVWKHFGYEGPSFPFGGYLERGFDDIDWLPKG